MDMLDKTYDRASCEIEDILQHQKFDKSDVELLGELVDIVKDVEMIYDYRNKMGNNGYMRSAMPIMPMVNRGSYTGADNTKSRDENKELMLNHLQNVANMAVDERDRKAVERLMEQMRQN